MKNVPRPYVTWIRSAARTCAAVNGPLLAAQIEQESNWKPRAVSPAGAKGVAQFKPATWATFGKDANHNGKKSPFEPPDAIMAQGTYMCYLARQVRSLPGNRATLMLWAYNAGPEATKAANGNPPTAEARHYAHRILTELVPKYRP
ncbi:lytic transglycosylase domain-containing protein [Actinoplanes sp. NPDC051475]|uniref:lytic transglycosylase domain-containing protein n=1 Tax=Actinoplanes sp. NPDC051475 TaxID=3157225 RepID=UPI00344BF385